MTDNSYRRAEYIHSVVDKKQTDDDKDNGGWYCKKQARNCNQCGKPTLIVYNLRTHQVHTFDLDEDKYPEQEQQRRKHRHLADNITRASVISSIAVEERFLFKRRPGDYDPVSRRIIR